MRITFVVLLCFIAAALAYPTGDLLDTMAREIMDERLAANNYVHAGLPYSYKVNPGEEPREVVNLAPTRHELRPAEGPRPRPGQARPEPEMPRPEMPSRGPGMRRRRPRPIEDTDSSRSDSSSSGSKMAYESFYKKLFDGPLIDYLARLME